MQKILSLILILFSLTLSAQYGETIRTGRPGQAIGCFTTGKNVLQFQPGITFDRAKLPFDDGTELTTTGISPILITRYGVTETFELSAVLGYASFKEKYNGDEETRSGINNTQFGMRVNLSQGAIPVCFQYRLKLNLLSDDFKNNTIGSRLLIAAATKLAGPFSLTLNTGLDWSGNSENVSGLYIVNLSFDIIPKLGGFVEYYGTVPLIEDGLKSWGNNFDFGLGYLVNPDLQLDISAGTNSDFFDEYYFIDFGFSWRTRFSQ